jgi:hypothetical protein
MTTGAAEGRLKCPAPTGNGAAGSRRECGKRHGKDDNLIPEAEWLMEEIVSCGKMMAACSKEVANPPGAC